MFSQSGYAIESDLNGNLHGTEIHQIVILSIQGKCQT